MNAYGLVEVSGASAAVTAVDIMCKTAIIELVTWERKWGGRLVTLIVRGDVDAVQAALEVVPNPVAVGILPNPHSEVIRLATRNMDTSKPKRRPKNGTRSIRND